jgi:hypothetical protein
MSKQPTSPDAHHYEERQTMIDGIFEAFETSDRHDLCEALATLLINLAIAHDSSGPDASRNELGHFTRLVFLKSEAFAIALKLYANRFDLTGEANLDTILTEYANKHLQRGGRQVAK